MKKLLILLFALAALTASASINNPNGDGNRTIIVQSSTNSNNFGHLAEPVVEFVIATCTLEVQFMAPPTQYVVTVTNLMNGIFLTDYSCSGCIPLPSNACADFLINIEVEHRPLSDDDQCQ